MKPQLAKCTLNHEEINSASEKDVYHRLHSLPAPVYLNPCGFDKTTHKLINSDSTWTLKSEDKTSESSRNSLVHAIHPVPPTIMLQLQNPNLVRTLPQVYPPPRPHPVILCAVWFVWLRQVITSFLDHSCISAGLLLMGIENIQNKN